MKNNYYHLPYNQKRIVDLLLQDLTSKEVAAKIGCKQTNVSNYLMLLRKKFKVHTNHGLLLTIQKQIINYESTGGI